MIVYRTLAEIPPPDGVRALVPTMGAFHEGHLHLMRTAKAETGSCWVSLFVNPIQFGPGEDFERYPRDEERDFAMAREAGVDAVFAPSPQEMYPQSVTTVSVARVSERWDGEFRPGHFTGVSTVVCKLLNIIQPTYAYFGLKDLQQCAVIRNMIRDLNIRVQLRLIETVREPDGLAMSSRNRYLSEADRAIAPLLSQSCRKALQAIAGGSDSQSELAACRAALERAGFTVEYAAMVNPETMEPLDIYMPEARIIAAARLGSTRLIDNVAV